MTLILKKIGQRILIAVGVLVTLFISVIVIYALTFNPNDYKPQIVRLVQEKKQRTLTLDGDIKLLFFPKLGVDLGRSWISEKNGDRQFASLQNARFYFSWLPLLRRQVVIDGINLEGLGAILVRHPDGATNFADLLETEASSWLKFDLQILKSTHGLLVFEDQLAERKSLLSDIELKYRPQQDITLTSKLSVDRPDTNLNGKLTSAVATTQDGWIGLKGLKLNMLGRVDKFSNLDVQLLGDFTGRYATAEISAKRLSLTAKANRSSKDFSVNAKLPALQLTANEFFLDRLSVESTMKNAQDTFNFSVQTSAMRGIKSTPVVATAKLGWRGRQDKVNFSGEANTAFAVDLTQQAIDFQKFSARLDVNAPPRLKSPVLLRLDGQGRLQRQPFSSVLSLKGTLDDSQLQGVASAMGTPLRYQFDMRINKLNLDRYLQPGADSPTPANDWQLSSLKDINAAGDIRIGQLTYGQTRASNVMIKIQ